MLSVQLSLGVLALFWWNKFPHTWEQLTDLADTDKGLEHAQLFELFVQKCPKLLTLG